MASPKIDFYLIEGATINDIFTFTCRLLEKVYQKHQAVFVLTENRTDAEKLNDQLWTFRDTSFIPHDIVQSANTPLPQEIPIQIGYENADCAHTSNLLINLAANIPSCCDKFERIIEIVSQEPTWQNNARDHFRKYKTLGYSIHTYDLKNEKKL